MLRKGLLFALFPRLTSFLAIFIQHILWAGFWASLWGLCSEGDCPSCVHLTSSRSLPVTPGRPEAGVRGGLTEVAPSPPPACRVSWQGLPNPAVSMWTLAYLKASTLCSLVSVPVSGVAELGWSDLGCERWRSRLEQGRITPRHYLRWG